MITRANGTSDTQTIASHGMRRPTRISTGVEIGSGFDTGTYAYDGAGNVTAMGSDGFTYDAFSRLETADVRDYAQAFSYDAYGNIEQIDTTPPGGTLESTVFPVDTDTNHLADASYDGAGSLTSAYEMGGTSRLAAQSSCALRPPRSTSSTWLGS